MDVLKTERIEPIIPVRNVAAALTWYRDVLGFDILWDMEGAAGLSLGNGQLMLMKGRDTSGLGFGLVSQMPLQPTRS